jgi:hypothetical protein
MSDQGNLLSRRSILTTGGALFGALFALPGIQNARAEESISETQRQFSVSVFDFMTPAQIADVQANTAAVNLARAIDVSDAIQAAVSFATNRALVGGTVYLPPGSYKISKTISSLGVGGRGQVGLIGSGLFATRIFPSGDFTAVKLTSSWVESGHFTIEWPSTPLANIPQTRVGVEFAGPRNQTSQTQITSIAVKYAFRGYVLQNWEGSVLGSMYLIKLSRLNAFNCADWGFYLDSKTGSTTLILELCYVLGVNPTGGQYGKGFYISNFNDVLGLSVAIDQCLNDWMYIQNANILNLQNIALESNKMTSSTTPGFFINATRAVIQGFKELAATYNTSGDADVIGLGANCRSLAIAGWGSQAVSIANGTTRYKVRHNSPNTYLSVLDQSILPSEVHDNGRPGNGTFNGSVNLSTSLSVAIPALSDGGSFESTLTIPGASLGDHVLVSYSQPLQGLQAWGWVVSANKVQIRFFNQTGTKVSLKPGLIRARIVPT